MRSTHEGGRSGPGPMIRHGQGPPASSRSVPSLSVPACSPTQSCTRPAAATQSQAAIPDSIRGQTRRHHQKPPSISLCAASLGQGRSPGPSGLADFLPQRSTEASSQLLPWPWHSRHPQARPILSPVMTEGTDKRRSGATDLWPCGSAQRGRQAVPGAHTVSPQPVAAPRSHRRAGQRKDAWPLHWLCHHHSGASRPVGGSVEGRRGRGEEKTAQSLRYTTGFPSWGSECSAGSWSQQRPLQPSTLGTPPGPLDMWPATGQGLGLRASPPSLHVPHHAGITLPLVRRV